jgi:hypothetical protein
MLDAREYKLLLDPAAVGDADAFLDTRLERSAPTTATRARPASPSPSAAVGPDRGNDAPGRSPRCLPGRLAASSRGSECNLSARQ